MQVRLKHFKQAAVNWYNNDPFSQSAAIAYYTIFSFPALAFIYLTLASLFAGQYAVEAQVLSYITQVVGERNAESITGIIEKSAPSYTNIWALIIGAVVLLFAALKLFLQMQKTFNLIWKVKVSENVSIWSIVKERMVAFSVMAGILFIMLTTLLVTTLLNALGEYIIDNISATLYLLVWAVNFVVSLSILSCLFTLMLKMLPDAKIITKYAFVGGVATALLFMLGQHLLGVYFNIAEPASSYGVAAAVILLMLWVSYACMIILFGAELTRVLQQANTGHKTKASKLAVNDNSKRA